MNYKQIHLDKSMYKADGGFSTQLEKIDPSHQYKGTSLEGLDAFQRQLKRFDIKVSGKHSDTISKFFATSDSAALFPEYVSRAVGQGAETTPLLEALVATTSVINSLDYRSITSSVQEIGNPEIPEGSALPETSIILSDTLIRLKKRGQLLKASYEAIKHQRADVITVALSQIGHSLVESQIEDAINLLVYGEGGIPGADIVDMGTAPFSYEALLDLWMEFSHFEMNTLVASPQTVRTLLTLPEFQESTTGDAFLSKGILMTPLGARLITSTAVADDTLLALDRRFALEMVTTGGIQVEYDKLIDTQLERAAITTTYGFSKLFPDAVKVLQRHP